MRARIYTAIVGFLMGITVAASTPVDAVPDPPKLRDRLNVCVAPRGDQASALPCIWYSPLQEEIDGNSRIVRRSGRVQPITDERGRTIFLAVIDRLSP